MNRRKFILLSGGVVAVAAIPAAYYFFGKVDYPSSFSNPISLAPILDSKAMKELGAAYCTQVPDESTERTIAKLLLKKLPTGDSQFTSTLETLIKKDFDELGK